MLARRMAADATAALERAWGKRTTGKPFILGKK
jgi:hypothetical protein